MTDVTVDKKACTTCGQTKLVSDFEPDARYRSGFRSQCKLCRYKAESTTPSSVARGVIKLDLYDKLFKQQDGLCAICGLAETRRKRQGPFDQATGNRVSRLSLDHDHVTGVTRGLLCSGCNVALGCMKDDPDRLEAAARYLRQHKGK